MLTTAFVPPTGRDALPRDPASLNGKEPWLRERKCVFAEAPKRMRRDLGRRTRESASPSPDATFCPIFAKIVTFAHLSKWICAGRVSSFQWYPQKEVPECVRAFFL